MIILNLVVLVCIISILSEAINATLAFSKPLDDLGILDDHPRLCKKAINVLE
jgi:hypothetical protein